MVELAHESGWQGSLIFSVKGVRFPDFPVHSGITKRELVHLHKLLGKSIPVLEPVFFPDRPCYQWVKAIDPDGYARHRPPGWMPGSDLVHRFMYEHVSGESLGDITVDHACGNRACINPAHLRLLDRKTNLELGDHRELYRV